MRSQPLPGLRDDPGAAAVDGPAVHGGGGIVGHVLQRGDVLGQGPAQGFAQRYRGGRNRGGTVKSGLPGFVPGMCHVDGVIAGGCRWDGVVTGRCCRGGFLGGGFVWVCGFVGGMSGGRCHSPGVPVGEVPVGDGEPAEVPAAGRAESSPAASAEYAFETVRATSSADFIEVASDAWPEPDARPAAKPAMNVVSGAAGLTTECAAT